MSLAHRGVERMVDVGANDSCRADLGGRHDPCPLRPVDLTLHRRHARAGQPHQIGQAVAAARIDQDAGEDATLRVRAQNGCERRSRWFHKPYRSIRLLKARSWQLIGSAALHRRRSCSCVVVQARGTERPRHEVAARRQGQRGLPSRRPGLDVGAEPQQAAARTHVDARRREVR